MFFFKLVFFSIVLSRIIKSHEKTAESSQKATYVIYHTIYNIILSNTSHGGNNVAARISSYTSCLIKTFTKRIVLRFVRLYYSPHTAATVTRFNRNPVPTQYIHQDQTYCVCYEVRVFITVYIYIYICITRIEHVHRVQFKVFLFRRF